MPNVVPRPGSLSTGYPQGRPQPAGGHHDLTSRDPEASLTAIMTLTVASLNLHCGLGWRGEPYDVAAEIRRLDAEVICLQEAWLPEPAAAAGTGGGEPPADAVADAARMLGAALYRV